MQAPYFGLELADVVLVLLPQVGDFLLQSFDIVGFPFAMVPAQRDDM